MRATTILIGGAGARLGLRESDRPRRVEAQLPGRRQEAIDGACELRRRGFFSEGLKMRGSKAIMARRGWPHFSSRIRRPHF